MKYVDKTTESGKIVKLKNYKRRIFINKLKRRFLLLLIILISITLILTYAPFMKIKSINCYGNEHVTSEEVVSLSGICIGNNIFRISTNRAAKSICTMPYVKNVTIKRKLPATINIDITECTVAGYINVKDTYIYIDDTSKVLEHSEIPPESPSPVITGVKVQKNTVGEIVELKNSKQIESLNEIFAVLSTSDFNGKATIINLTDLNNITMTINNSLEIIIGDTENLDYKINFLASGAYANIGDNRSGTLNVSYGTNAVFKEKQ